MATPKPRAKRRKAREPRPAAKPIAKAAAALPRPREIVSAGEVMARIATLAAEVARDFAGRLPLLVVIAEGARRFADALKLSLTVRGVAVDTLVVKARRTVGRNLVDVIVDDFDAKRCTGRDLLVVDDIADEGRTMTAVLARARSVRPSTVKTAVLVSKHARRCMPIELDYVGFDVADGWVVGFGMDLDGRFRELDHLAVVEEPSGAVPEGTAKEPS
jgi:hypoxanthine phosphoribosyltransferase